MTADARIAIAEEAARLEAAGLDWDVKHVAAILGVSRSVAYDTAWVRQCSHVVGRNARRWTPAEFRIAREAERARRDGNDLFRSSARKRGRRTA